MGGLLLLQSLRVLLQQGVQPSWFSLTAASMDEELVVKSAGQPLGTRGGDLRHYLLETSTPMLGETVFAEVLLKTLEPYRKAGELHKAASDTHPTHHHQEVLLISLAGSLCGTGMTHFPKL